MIRLTATILPVLLIALMACAALLSACGGGSGNSSTATRESGGGESGRAAEFKVPGGNKQEVNRIIAGSKEATAAEREAAGLVLAKSLKARSKHDWAAQCATLSKKMVEVVEKNSLVLTGTHGCTESLAAAASEASKQTLTDTLGGKVGALRLVGGEQAFAFFHGTDGRDYLIPMEQDGGDWKVASLTAEPIPGS